MSWHLNQPANGWRKLTFVSNELQSGSSCHEGATDACRADVHGGGRESYAKRALNQEICSGNLTYPGHPRCTAESQQSLPSFAPRVCCTEPRRNQQGEATWERNFFRAPWERMLLVLRYSYKHNTRDKPSVAWNDFVIISSLCKSRGCNEGQVLHPAQTLQSLGTKRPGGGEPLLTNK